MELVAILQRLWKYRILTALVLLVAVLAAVVSSYDIGSSGLTKRASTSRFGAAQGQFYVDTRRPSLITAEAQQPDLIARSKTVASFIGAGRVRSALARIVGVPVAQIQVEGPLPDQPGSSAQPVAQQRANQLVGEGSPYKIFVDTDPSSPTVTLFVQAPDGARASRLASAVPAALKDYLDQLTRDALPAEKNRFDRAQVPTNSKQALALQKANFARKLDDTLAGRTVIRTVGAPVGGNVTTQSSQAIGGLVFIVVLVGGVLIVLLIGAVRDRRRAA
ncbi:hypothetical protein [Patulibacter minatonensis]|uniref:hypothetical protein n=1 Tax=Patulibacter minatonensis TaxID=298163 RepID=UPI0004B46EFD|nr:hypothetical protein [Patulibacter minatonensis]